MDRSRHCRGRMKGDLMKIDLKGKVALVTGGGRGIGRVIATQLEENGARETIAPRTEESGREVAEHLSEKGGTVDLRVLEPRWEDSAGGKDGRDRWRACVVACEKIKRESFIVCNQDN